MLHTGGDLRRFFTGVDLEEASFYALVYSEYVKLRTLKIPLNPVDLDPDTLDILFYMQSTVEAIEEKRRKKKRG